MRITLFNKPWSLRHSPPRAEYIATRDVVVYWSDRPLQADI